MVRLVVHVGVRVLVSAALGEAQAPATRLSLDDAVALALRENPTLRAKQHEYRATQAQEITAGLRPNPTASSLTEQIGSRNDPQYTFSLGQPIELGGKRARRLDSSRAASRVTAAELEGTPRQVVAQVKKGFTDTLGAEATLALTGEKLKALAQVGRLQRNPPGKGGQPGPW